MLYFTFFSLFIYTKQQNKYIYIKKTRNNKDMIDIKISRLILKE